MFAATIDDPRYGLRFVEHHLTGSESVPAIRQMILNGIKMVRALAPLDWEARPDVEALRRWLDALAVPAWQCDGAQLGVSAVRAAHAAIEADDFGLAAFSRQLGHMSDELLLYARLAYRREIGRRGEALRGRIEEELLHRPWLIEQPEDARDYDPAVC